MGAMANSDDPDERAHSAAFHQGLHCLLRQNQSLRKKVNVFVLETTTTYNPSSIQRVKGRKYRPPKSKFFTQISAESKGTNSFPLILFIMDTCERVLWQIAKT